MKVVCVNKTTAVVNDFYRINRDIAESWQGNKEIEDIVDKMVQLKQEFINDVKVSSTEYVSFFSEVLVLNEIKTGNDIMKLKYNELAELIKEMANVGLFKTKSTYISYVNIIYNYTQWGYDNHYRGDIVTYEDISEIVPYNEIANYDLLKQKLLTPKEMDKCIEQCFYEASRLGLMAAREGLKIADIVDLKRKDFNTLDNHEIETNKRIVKLSDDLYAGFYHYAHTNEIEMRFRDTTVTYELYDTEYIMRIRKPTKPKKNKKFSVVSFGLNITRDLRDSASVDLSLKDFRISSMLYDYINDMNLEDMNKKYGTKHNTLRYYSFKYEVEIEVLRNKLKEEENK